MEEKIVFVLLTDENYFNKCKKTILDLKSIGKWIGDVVVISVNFNIPDNFKKLYNIIEVSFQEINKHKLINLIKTPFEDSDQREFNKLNQWEKLHVFDTYFLNWDKVIFLDAGLRILDSVEYLLNLDCNHVFMAPNDAGVNENPNKIFSSQISCRDTQLVDNLTNEFGKEILNSQYFLNCIWMYDTKILNVIKKEEMIEYMYKYPLCKTNEMTIMNLIIHFKYKLWKPFPHYIPDKTKYLFDWCELNNYGTRWNNYCYLKYPVTISFDDV